MRNFKTRQRGRARPALRQFPSLARRAGVFRDPVRTVTARTSSCVTCRRCRGRRGGGVEAFGPLEGRFLARQRRQVRKGGPRSNDAFGAVEQLAQICLQLGLKFLVDLLA